jgi:hypothetical protein
MARNGFLMMALLLSGMLFSQVRNEAKPQNWSSKIGFSGGAFVPLNTFSGRDSTSLIGGCFIGFPISANQDELVFELSYLIAHRGPDVNRLLKSYGFGVTHSLTMLNIYTRFGILPSIFIDSGCGLYFPKVSGREVIDTGVVRSACFGLCLGPAFRMIHSHSIDTFASAKFHTYHGDSGWAQFIRLEGQIALKL